MTGTSFGQCLLRLFFSTIKTHCDDSAEHM